MGDFVEKNTQTNWEEEGKETAQTVGSFIWELVRVFIIALLIIVPIRVFVAEREALVLVAVG